jgi:hypothetical protein
MPFSFYNTLIETSFESIIVEIINISLWPRPTQTPLMAWRETDPMIRCRFLIAVIYIFQPHKWNRERGFSKRGKLRFPGKKTNLGFTLGQKK